MPIERIKVGGMTYAVTVQDEPLILGNKTCKGIIDYEFQTIKLAGDKVQSQQGRMQTLLHELVHAFTHNRNLDWGDKDELYTDEIAIALHAFLIDNAELIKSTNWAGEDDETFINSNVS